MEYGVWGMTCGTYSSDVPERKSLVSRGRDKRVGEGEEVNGIDRVHMASQCGHTHSSERE